MEVGKNPFEGDKTTNLYTNTTIGQATDLQSLDNGEEMGSIFEADASYSDGSTLNYEILEDNEIELIKKELERYIGELKTDLENSDISLYGRQRVSIPVYAIKFLSDTKAVCTGFYVKMNGRDNYEISLNEIKIDLEKVLDNLKIQYALQWNKEDCLIDPDIITLHKANKKRKQNENGGNEKTL